MRNVGYAITFLLLASLFAMPATAHLKHLTWIEVEDWQAEHIARVIALDHEAQSGEFLYVLADHKTREIEGRRCLVGGLYVFDVADDFLFDTDEDITIELTFHRPTSKGFIYSYDKATGRTLLDQRKIAPSGNSVWHTEIVTLERAAFANRVRASSDFLIGSLGAIFTGVLAVDENTTVSLCDVKIRRGVPKPREANNATLKLSLTDENGEPTAARVGIYDPDGRAVPPSDDAVPVVFLYGQDERRVYSLSDKGEHWPGKGRYIFWADGEYKTRLPAGEYQLVASKGFEYHIVDSTIVVKPGTNSVDIALKRWTNMPAKGWYSGDDHIHLGRERSDNKTLIALGQAEDLHMSVMLQMGNVGQYFFEQYAFGKNGEYQVGNHALVSGQENQRTGDIGHVIGMNTQRYHNPEKYYLYGDVADAVHAEGGLWGYAHVALAEDAIGMPESMAHTVPLGQVDFVEQLQFRTMITRLLYDFLNPGFPIVPIAGSDAPYLNIVGAERFYVYTGSNTLDTKAFYDGIRAGNVFVTSGPMLEFAVNGKPAGSKVNIASGETVTVTATATINPDIDKLDRLELVLHGEVIASASSEDGALSLSLEQKLSPRESAWVAVRAYGKKAVDSYRHQTQAHSGIAYILVDGDVFFGERDKLAELTAKYKAKLDKLHDKRPWALLQNERDHFDQEDVDREWDESLPEMRERIRKSHEIYDRRLKRYGRSGK